LAPNPATGLHAEASADAPALILPYMNIPIASALDLLHATSYGTLATQAEDFPGYPYVSVLPFVLDERHAPVFLISSLAEHTKNLRAQPRASFFVHAPVEGNVLAGARLTLLGSVTPYQASERLIARYLRYQPDAERYLALADFAFYRLAPVRLRLIAGFGEMGWIAAEAFKQAASLALEDEERLLREASLPSNTKLLGLDPYGVDWLRDGVRERQKFMDTPLSQEALKAALQRLAQT
jgi:heme iron utilization protein